MFKAKEREKQDLKKLYEKIPDEILRARIQSAGEWYINSSFLYKWLFYAFGFAGIAIPILVTAVNGIYSADTVFVKNFTIICSAITALSTAFLSFSKCREKWTLYRSTIEKIKRELSLYWSENMNDQKLQELVSKLEAYMQEENAQWMVISSKDHGAEEKSDPNMKL